MFKKPKRNFRKKQTEFNSDDESNVQENDNETQTIVPKISKEKNKSKSTGVNPVVSFEVEEQETNNDFFKVKKSSTSRRLAKQMKKEKARQEKSSKNGHDEMDDSGDENDNEYAWSSKRMEAVKKKRKETEEERRRAEEKLRQLREEFRTMNGDEAEALDDENDDKAFKNMLARGEIPDAKTIHFIRKQRQMARDTDGYIPIQEEEKSNKSTKSTARLIRDDDNDRSDDEEENRIDFSVNQAARDRQQIRDDFLAAEHGSDEDSDQDREWEKQQIKKAVSLQIPGVEIGGSNSHNSNVYFEGSYDYQSSMMMEREDVKPFKTLSNLQDSSEINIEIVRKQLQERLSTMDSVYRTHKLEYEKVVVDLDTTRDSEELCGTKVPLLENRYRFFQELRGYVRDLVDCLNEKMPILQDLEQRVNNLLKNRAARLTQRRQQDIQDQCRDYMTSKVVKIDNEDAQQQLRQRRAADREARRSRRRRMRESKSITGHYDGLSSDDEESSQSQVLKLNAEMEEIKQTRDTLFDDVVSDFSDIEVVKEHFERWKFTYTETYQEAYIGLCMPKLLNPFIRIELLTWNPLEHCNDFEESRWYNILVFMGYKEGTEMKSSDNDSRIIPSIIEKVVVPKITNLVENVWDPMSTTQTSRLVNLISRLINDYPTIHAENKIFRVLMEAVVARFKKTLDDDVFMPMYPISVLDNRSSGPSNFFHRQSWSSIKLLGNMLSWHQILSAPILKKLAFSDLLNRYIVVGLVNSHINREALQKCQVIISTFPKEWFASLEADATLPQLENLCRYLVGAAETLHKASSLEPYKGGQEGRDLVKQISKHLVNIHAMDHAMSLANRFSIHLQQL